MLATIISMALIFAIVIMAFWPVIQELQRRKDEMLRNERRLAAAMEEERRQTREIELIKNNTAYLEHLARVRLNMGKPGEVIYNFDPYKVMATNSSPKVP